MARKYKMTPRRKAALKKAQAASARKRKSRTVRRVAIGAGAIGATLAAAGGAYAGRSYLKTTFGKGSGRKGPISKELVHVPGLGKDHKVRIISAPFMSLEPAPRSLRSTPSTVIKVSKKGKAVVTTKGRMTYDLNRRRTYWQAKPVGGSPRKKYVSHKRGRE